MPVIQTFDPEVLAIQPVEVAVYQTGTMRVAPPANSVFPSCSRFIVRQQQRIIVQRVKSTDHNFRVARSVVTLMPSGNVWRPAKGRVRDQGRTVRVQKLHADCVERVTFRCETDIFRREFLSPVPLLLFFSFVVAFPWDESRGYSTVGCIGKQSAFFRETIDG